MLYSGGIGLYNGDWLYSYGMGCTMVVLGCTMAVIGIYNGGYWVVKCCNWVVHQANSFFKKSYYSNSNR